MTFKDNINDKAGQHIVNFAHEKNINAGELDVLQKFWKGPMQYVIHEIEWAMDDFSDAERADELQDLITAIEADALIDKEDDNVKRIVGIINNFIEENEMEVDFEDIDTDDPNPEGDFSGASEDPDYGGR